MCKLALVAKPSWAYPPQLYFAVPLWLSVKHSKAVASHNGIAMGSLVRRNHSRKIAAGRFGWGNVFEMSGADSPCERAHSVVEGFPSISAVNSESLKLGDDIMDDWMTALNLHAHSCKLSDKSERFSYVTVSFMQSVSSCIYHHVYMRKVPR